MKKYSLILIFLFLSFLGFSQLDTTNISTTLVGNEIGNSSRNVGVLCTSATINKWSRYKPVSGTFPQANDGRYGLNLNSNWDYISPSGGASSPYRLGDFRGYQHTTSTDSLCMPPVLCLDADFDSNTTLYPVGGTSQSNFTIKAYRTATTNANGILPSLFTPDLDGYYYGIRLTQGATSWIKTSAETVAYLNETGTNVQIAVTLNGSGTTWYYANFPDNLEGSVTVELIVSDTQYTDWTASPSATYYTLPSGTFDGITIKSSIAINVLGWVAAEHESLTWDEAGDNDDAMYSIITTKSSSTSWGYSNINSHFTVVVQQYISGDEVWEDYTTETSFDSGDRLKIVPDIADANENTSTISLYYPSDATTVLETIALTQEIRKVNPTIITSIDASASGIVTNPLATVTLGSTTITWSFDGGGYYSGTVTVQLQKNNKGLWVNVDSDTVTPIETVSFSDTFTLTAAADYNEEYRILFTYE